MKTAHQSVPPAVDATDPVNKDYGDTNYSGGGGGSGGGGALYSYENTRASFQYAGITDAAQEANGGVLDGMTDLTVMLWVRPLTLGVNQVPVGKWSASAGNYSYRFYIDTSNQLQFYTSTDGSVNGNKTVAPSTPFAVGKWRHIAATYIGSTGVVQLYMDGLPEGTTGVTTIGGIFDGNADFRVGAFDLTPAPNFHFDGDISNVAVFNTALTADQIANYYLRQLSGSEPNVVGYWPLDNDYLDRAAAGNDLTPAASPAFVRNVPFGTQAHAIVTNEGLVQIGDSDPPVKGQVLTATGTAAATWQTPVTPSPAQGDYITVVLNHNHDAVVDSPVEFDVESEKRGSLALDAINYRVTGLKAGRTYLIQSQIRIQFESGTFKPYDVTNGAYLDTEIGCQPIHVTRSDNTSSTPIASIVHTPTTDIDIEMRCSGVNGATCDVHGGWTWLQVIEIGATVVSAVSGLEFMDRIEVDASTSSVTFGEGGDGVFGRALDGDTDGRYMIVGTAIRSANETAEITLRPNGITANQKTVRSNFTSSGHFIQVEPTLLIENATAQYTFFRGLLDARTGFPRHWLSDSANTEPGFADADLKRHDTVGKWDDTSTNITSLVLNIATSTFEPGSSFALYRMSDVPVRADSASTYERQVTAAVAQGTAAEVEYTTGHATFQGSAIGVSVSLNGDTVTAGTITVNLKVAGSTVLTATLDTTNTSFNRAIENVGVHGVTLGDEIVVGIATSGLTTTGGGSPGITVNASLVNDALVQPSRLPDYMLAGLTADQTTNVAVGNHVEWDVSTVRGTSISLSAGAGQLAGILTLAGGKTYKIETHLTLVNNEGQTQAQWRDDNGDATLQDALGEDNPLLRMTDNAASDTPSNHSSVFLFSPTIDTDIKLDVLQTAGLQWWYKGCRVLITEFF